MNANDTHTPIQVGTPLRALLVEDNIYDAELVEFELRRAGFEPSCVRVENESVYREALAQPWDVIIADYILPHFSAPNALTILGELESDIPFIVVTGQAGEDLAVELIRSGASDYLMKDRLLRLGSAVRRALDVRVMRHAKREADRAMRDSERRHRMITSYVTDYACSVFLADDGSIEIEWATKSMEEFLGRTLSECVVLDGLAALLHPDDLSCLLSQHARAVNRESSVEELRLCDNEGRIRWVRNYFLIDEEQPRGEGLRVFIAGQDITAQKHEQEALSQRTTELMLRNDELDAYAHTVAHDLRNPLNLIIGYAELFSDDEETPVEEVRQHLKIIARTGRLMNNIIEELMLLAGVRKADPDMIPIDLGLIARSAMQRVAHIADEAGAHITLHEPLPWVLGHGPWLEEALVNYLSNAIKYGGAPPVIEISGLVRNGSVGCAVRDNGAGIPEDQHDRLFAPFSRLSEVRAQGHGLGLSIVRRIIERMSGSVAVESAPGLGSSFSFLLPSSGLPGAG